jgi:hypothetical protein
MRYRKMTERQLLVYGARVRLAWFRKAEELGSVVAACRYYGAQEERTTTGIAVGWGVVNS